LLRLLHTLEAVIPDIERRIGSTINRLVADKGYRGHNAPEKYKFRIYLSGQKRGVTEAIKRDLKRRSAVDLMGCNEHENDILAAEWRGIRFSNGFGEHIFRRQRGG
jgi:hypothetical protein